MKRGRLLNLPLSGAIAALGHGDLLLVVDAGFPIPPDANRIDLALEQDVPNLRTVLELVHSELIVEAVVIAAEAEVHNPRLASWIRDEFAGSELELVPHADMLAAVPRTAKAIVRTGAFDPWGNVGLRSGVDVGRWFTGEGVVAPDYYRERIDDPARRAP
jgi:simple sugar transport system permease protein/D-ribose pyranase